ncbi:hypothetical protein [Fulvimonas soli]|jgi:hypothetical protein|uniref:Uncharacterized protein n=1 Tax=Fulvimonas soli TaxID=155197 RepID=A0A316I9N5_9GAMM|nr:hypothetical protein [Fulvimonas soli]PWK89765.1 hypothetical protein C7456_104116 [Fulvimonas soli]
MSTSAARFAAVPAPIARTAVPGGDRNRANNNNANRWRARA